MITIHEKNTTSFDNLGLGVLSPSFCIVKEELNGIFELELEHYYDDLGKWKYIENDRILYASTPRGKQPFRIYKVNPTMNGITVYAHHIFYDLLDNFIISLKASGTAQNVLNTLKSSFDVSMPFTFDTNITYSGMVETEKVNPVQALLSSDDDRDSFIKVFGGELLRDNYNVSVMASIGADRGVQIRYRKNLIGLEVEEDISDVVTKIYPIGSDGLTLSEKYINSPRINDYPYPKIFIHEDSDCKTQTDLRASAQRLLSCGADLPKINIKADFQLLSRTEEYKNFSVLEEVQLGDLISVINEKMNFSKKAKVISYEWDCLLDKYNQVELGDFIEDITKGVTVGQKAINVANTASTGASLALDKVENLAVVAKTGSYKDLKDKPTDLGGADGYTPIKGIDYFDGKDGKDGISSSNPNLLINGDFSRWDRGASFTALDYVYNQYTANRYKCAYKGTISKDVNGFRLNGEGDIRYTFEDDFISRYKGKTLTFSISVNGETYHCVCPNFLNQYNGVAVKDIFAVSISGTLISIFAPSAVNAVINWVKLEPDDVATPLIPRLIGDEIALGQRYYLSAQDAATSSFTMVATGGNILQGSVAFPTTMRVPPTPSFPFHARKIKTGEVCTITNGSFLINENGLNTIHQITTDIPLVVGEWYSMDIAFDAEIY